MSKGQQSDALTLFRAAAQSHPDSTDAQLNLATALKDTGHFEESAALLKKILTAHPESANAHRQLAHALEKLGHPDQAIAEHRAAADLSPQSPFAQYDLAALGAGPTPAAAPTPYIIQYFNDYAPDFDHHLVNRLHYQAPELLLKAVTATNPKTPMDILDLGCGTGLVGELFRPLAAKIVGIDLSPKIIPKSRQRNVYDQLIESDLLPALKQYKESYDAILAADVFIYIGNLNEIFPAAANALRPRALFAFTIESTETDTNDYTLRPSRRYAQSLPYIRRLATENNFTELSIQEALLRHSDTNEHGQVILLQKN